MIRRFRYPPLQRSLAGWAALALLLGALLPGFIRALSQPAANVTALAGLCITRSDAGASAAVTQVAALAAAAVDAAADRGMPADPVDHVPCCAFCLPVGQAAAVVPATVQWQLPPAASAVAPLPAPVAVWPAPTVRLPQPRAPPASV